MGNKYGRVVEDVTGTAMGSVVYYNGEKSLKVLQSLNNPYGKDYSVWIGSWMR